jgi:RNA recognition motif-containing protein
MAQNNKLYVGNLSFKTTEDSLAEAFRPFGNVLRASVVTDRETGRARGFGFVEMSTDEEAQAAISALNGAQLDGRQIQVNVARPREDRPRSGGGGGGGGNYGGGGGGGGGRRDRY